MSLFEPYKGQYKRENIQLKARLQELEQSDLARNCLIYDKRSLQAQLDESEANAALNRVMELEYKKQLEQKQAIIEKLEKDVKHWKRVADDRHNIVKNQSRSHRELEIKLDAVRPYIQHTPNCPVKVIHYALAPVCDCGLQAILEKDDG